ncbi:hsp70, partial [Thraustotheca clavata]
MILSFFRLEHEMLSHLQEKDYIRAVEVCVAMQSHSYEPVSIDRFVILRSIRRRVARAIPELRQQFDETLVALIHNFNSTEYGSLVQAITLLDSKSPSSVSSIPQIIVRGLEDICRQFIQTNMLDTAMGKREGNMPTASQVIEELLDCYEVLVKLLHSYNLFVQWHENLVANNPEKFVVISDEKLSDQIIEASTLHLANFEQYRCIVWEQMQQSLADIIDRLTITNDFKAENVVALAQSTLLMASIGANFSNQTTSQKLTTALTNKCRGFLKTMQKDSIELLRMLLDTEKWERLSVSLDHHQSSITTLLEQRSGYSLPTRANACRVQELCNPTESILVKYSTHGNPFSLDKRSRFTSCDAMQRYTFENKPQEDPLGDEEENMIKRLIDMDPYLNGDFNSEAMMTPQQEEIVRFGSKHVISSSSLSGFIRLCGVYMKLMEQLPHLAWNAFLELANLFDFVFYASVTISCPDNYLARLLTRQTPSDLNCEELRQQLSRIQSEFNLGLTPQSVPVRVTQLPLSIANSSENNRFAIIERVVVMESLVFQWHVFSTLHQNTIKHFIPSENHTMMETMMVTMDEAVKEARSYVYACMAPSLISATSIPSMIERALWDTFDLSEQHNEYVVTLVRRCGIFWGMLQGSPVPIEVRDEIWLYVVRAIMEALVEGYASVKKCSLEGRALMSMDLIALQNGLDLINHVSNQDQSLWSRSYVNNYIKAYYFQEKELLDFITINKKHYRKAHLISLAMNGVCGQIRRVHFNGKVSIIANDQGFRTTPCVVAFETEDVVVGDSAVAKLHNNAANTVYHLKRVLGKKHADVKSLDYIKGWSFEVKPDKKGYTAAAVTHKDAQREVSAQEFASLVLRKLKDLAEDYTGVKINNCVLSVPQEFSEEQKTLMNEAAKLAGIQVMRYISEPIAAAIAYGFDETKSIESKLIVVVDIGGASSDITLLSADKGLFNVLGHVGDDALGGEDFTHALLEHCVKTFERQKKVVLKDNTRALYRIKLACEQAKKSLSTQSQVTIEVDSLAEGHDMIVKLSRSRFEEMIGDYVRKAVVDINKLLEETNMDKESIDHVILAGGSTRIPKVQAAIEDLFDNKKATSTIVPDEAIAYGATVEAATLSETADWDNLPSDPLNMVEAVPLNLSLGLADGTVYEMIQRNTILPATAQEVFTTHVDNQKAVYLQVYEGQRLMAKDNTLLANLTISGIPPMEAGSPEIEVSFNVTRKSVLTVKAHL